MLDQFFSSEAYTVLRNKNFRWYMLGRFTLTLALQIQSLAVAWQVYKLTGDPLALGFVGLAEVISAISTALFADHVADRCERKIILLSAQSFSVILHSFGDFWRLYDCWDLSVLPLALSKPSKIRYSTSGVNFRKYLS